MSATIDVEHLAGDERRAHEEQHGFDDLFNRAQPPQQDAADAKNRVTAR
jgi:hypothetical protein